MTLLSILLLASPLANIDLDIRRVIPETTTVASKAEFKKAIEQNNDQSIDILHFVTAAWAYGFHPVRLVIRAANIGHANNILEYFVSQLNLHADVNEVTGKFVYTPIKEEASLVEIHDFIKNKHGTRGSLIFLEGSLKSKTFSL